MASVLTSSSFKGSLLYLGLIAIVVVSVFYFMLFRQPDVQEGFYRQSFRLNHAAFANGVRLANYQWIVKKRTSAQKAIEKESIADNIQSLIFNSQGFPFAAEVSVENQQLPQTPEDCIAVWQKVLGPLRPEISVSETDNGYWVSLSEEGQCVIKLPQVRDLEINYDAILGKVELLRINS